MTRIRTPWSKVRLVEVTPDDIAYGVSDPIRCPVALALCRAFEAPLGTYRVTRALHNDHWVGVAEVNDLTRFRLSQAVGRFIWDFDTDQPVEPFAFRVWP